MKEVPIQILFLFLTACCPCVALAGSFNAGAGLAFVDGANLDGFDGGWDLQFGYEAKETTHWGLGVQLHLLKGWTSKSDVEADSDMSFRSTAVYFTARPMAPWAQWLQLKAGIANANYVTADEDNKGTGTALGVGVVLGSEKVQWHLLDYQRYAISGDQFNVYSISLAVLFH
jgi:hypothetical protein